MRRRFFLFAAVAAMSLAGCTSGSSYREAVSSRSPCFGCTSPWAEYGKIIRGVNPCKECGEDDACGCHAPAVACTPPPCGCKPCAAPAPCAPKPCGCASPCGCPKPCATPAPCAKPCATSPATGCAPCEMMCKVEIPPTYETVWENVETECPRCTQVWVPPVKQIRMRDVCVKPPCTCEVDLPAVKRTETYCVEVCPAHDEVVPGDCGCPKTVHIPAKTETRTREVCIAPPERKVVYEPALYRTDAVPCEVAAGYWQTLTTPGIVERRPRIVCKTPGRTEWVRKTCAPGAPMPEGAMPIPAGAMPPPASGSPMPSPTGTPPPPPPPPPTPAPAPAPTPMPVAPK